MGRRSCLRRRQAGVAFLGGATKQTRVILQYAKTNRGVFVSYNKHGTGRGGQGRTFGTYLRVRLRAQKPLSDFCSRPVLGGGTAVEQPGRERCSAARHRSLEQRRPSPAFGRRRRSRDRESVQCRSISSELRHRENLQGSWQCARATCSFCDNTATNLEMTRRKRIWA